MKPTGTELSVVVKVVSVLVWFAVLCAWMVTVSYTHLTLPTKAEV